MINKLIVLQPISLCNLNCSYCYVVGRRDPKLMSEDVVDACARVIFNSSVVTPHGPQDKILISWHAGEPLAAGIDFYQKAVDTFKRHNHQNIPYTMNIQTNAVLLNDAWCDFFKANDFTVSMSVDGPEFIHNRFRVDWKNKGSFDRVLKGMRYLKKHKIPLTAICVITEESLSFPDEIYTFFRDHHFTSVGFNVDEKEGTHAQSTYESSSIDSSISPHTLEKFKQFFTRLFELWKRDGKPFSIREFDHLLLKMGFYAKHDYETFVFATESIAFANIGITKTGDIVTFSPELAAGTPDDPKKFVIGNVLDIQSFDELEQNANFQSQLKEITQSIRNCAQECEYFDLCGGGTPANKFYEKGSFEATETNFCILTKKMMTDVVLEQLKTEDRGQRTDA